MAASLPVLAYAVGGNPAGLDGVTGYLFPLGDWEEGLSRRSACSEIPSGAGARRGGTAGRRGALQRRAEVVDTEERFVRSAERRPSLARSA